MQQTSTLQERSPSRAVVNAPLPEERSSWIHAVLLLALCIVVMFHPILFGGKTTMFSADSCSSIMPGGAYSGQPTIGKCTQRTRDPIAPATQVDPYIKYTGWCILHKLKFPFWNNYSGCGAPFMANMQSQLFCPLTIVASMFASTWAIDFYVLSRLMVAGVCAFFALNALIPSGRVLKKSQRDHDAAASSGSAGILPASSRSSTTDAGETPALPGIFQHPAGAKSAALIGAVGYMLTGYMLHALNLPELSVSIVIPALILGVEALVQKPCIASLCLCAGAVAVNLFGGFPEITFNALMFSGFYLLIRLLILEGWKLRLRIFGLVAAAYLAGLLISLPQILPFLEFLKSSYNLHDPAVTGNYAGLVHDEDWRRGLLSYIFPSGWAQKCYARGFYGAALGFLAFMGACLASLRFARVKSERKICAVILFFCAAFVIMMLKRFGCPLVQWFGVLPLANMIFFHEYNEPLMALCIACLASFGVSSVQQRIVKPRYVAVMALGFWLLASFLYYLYRGGTMIGNFDLPKEMGFNMRLGLGTLCVSAVLCLASYKSERLRKVLPVLLVIPFLFETYNSYMTQAFYGPAGVAERRLDPYKGAPYIDFLKGNGDPSARLIGFDGLLNPNWSMVFGIKDVRSYDAMYPAGYNRFIANFLPQLGTKYWDYEYYPDRFTGAENSMHHSLADLYRLCELTSAKYILSIIPLEKRTDLIMANQPMDSSQSGIDAICYAPSATIDGMQQSVLLQRPKSKPWRTAVKFTVSVPTSNPQLNFDFVRNPDVSCPPRSMPVHAMVLVNSLEDKSMPVRFEFDSADPTRFHATHYSIDLSRFAGKNVVVTLACRPPAGKECFWEWVGWTRMYFPEHIGERCIYDREAKIYELPGTLPHASVFSKVTIVDNEQAALDVLKSQSFSPAASVVFCRDDLPSGAREQLLSMRGAENCRPATVSRYESDRVEIELMPDAKPAVLLLTDMRYPGWRAYVDGKESNILKANYCFRGLLLPAGARRVSFRYDPWSFKIGVGASLLTLLVLSYFWFEDSRRRRRIAPEL